MEGRLDSRRDRDAAEEIMGSKRSLGATLAKGFMAGLRCPMAKRRRPGNAIVVVIKCCMLLFLLLL
jgi:hypothetical protein